MANEPAMLYFLLALESSGEIPFTPKDYADWMQYNRKLHAEHTAWRTENPKSVGNKPEECCEACKMVIEMEAKYAEHQVNPSYYCGKPCHVCDEFREAHKEVNNAQQETSEEKH